MNTISRQDVICFFDKAADVMAEHKDYLTEMDAALGDGDLGLTMTSGFAKAKEAVHCSEETDLGKLFMLAGMTIAKAAPSTMGTLVGSGFMKVGKAFKGKKSMGIAELAAFVDQFVEGLMERGKARPGDRTIIDAMYPAARYLEKAHDAGASLEEAAKGALAAAEEGLEATKSMVAAFGRGVFFGEQVLGKPDQGATVGVYIIQVWKEIICA
ncbi:MAG TPA: dihydroxyacetone kinase subunit L [Feifaniaceae bacterium]|nr:dihydroxyacetone kinase subunit L [Feifaniaceae bacterium]